MVGSCSCANPRSGQEPQQQNTGGEDDGSKEGARLHAATLGAYVLRRIGIGDDQA